jgi:hypothetical protein
VNANVRCLQPSDPPPGNCNRIDVMLMRPFLALWLVLALFGAPCEPQARFAE